MAKKKPVKRKPREPDPNVTAKGMIDRLAARAEGRGTPEPQSEPEPKKNRAAQELSKLGAAKGGEARAKKLSAKRRSQIAKKAAKARWTDRNPGADR